MKKFAQLHQQQQVDEGDGDFLPIELPEGVDRHERRPEYLINEGVNYYKQLSLLVLLYAHVKTGAKIPNIFSSETQEFEEGQIIFQATKKQ
jgi:hypothetical protein